MAKLDTLLQAAVAHHRGGRLGEARKRYEQILRADPKHPHALQLLGMALIEGGAAERGFQLLRRAVAYAPRSIEALNNLAAELARAGRPEEALGFLDRVLALDPRQPEALYNRACALRDLDRHGEALAAYDRLLAAAPDHATALADRGVILHALGRPDDALASYDRALAAGAEHPTLLANRAAALLALGRPIEALASCDEALARRPDDADALFHRGNAQRALGRSEAALDSYDGALALSPVRAEARSNRALALLDLGRFPAAAEALSALPAEHPYARGRLLHAKLSMCDWRDFAAESAAVQAGIARGERTEIPFMALAHIADPALQRRCAEIYVADKHPDRPDPQPRHPPGERIRIAYLSGDFGSHPTSYLMAGVFEQHDRSRFEAIAVSFRPPENSPIGRRVAAAFDRFLDISRITDAEAVAMLRAERIDIAIDLMGHTAGSRTGILARRIAPVQIAYLGYPGTSAVAGIDAIIADAIVAPPGCEPRYSERIIRLPRCFQANDDRRTAEPPPERAAAGLPERAVVFGAFNNSFKITPDVFACWMRLLAAVPESVLWVLAVHPAAHDALRREAGAHGIDKARLVFAGRVPYPAHLARVGLADVALDTFPFNGGATTSDVLRAGVPVVTQAGTAFASRMGASLLHAVGAPDLVAGDMSHYETIALRLATDPPARAELRHRLAEGGAALFDTAAFTRRLEQAFVEAVAKQD